MMKNFFFKKSKEKFLNAQKMLSGCIAGIMLLESLMPITSIAANGPLGSTVYTNDYVDFSYTGSGETFTVPVSGKYKLEVWGAEGGAYDSDTAGGDGGYSVGEIILNAVNSYCSEVTGGIFPAAEHTFKINDEVIEAVQKE